MTAIDSMAARVAAFPWERTPLGPRHAWPPSLVTAVGICLNNRFPMFVWWGPELINIYNDAYAPLLGARHPDALGARAQDTWSDIWDVVGREAEAVMQRGESTWNDCALLVTQRKGFTEETWFTWSYSPIPDEHGGIGGLFCACTEETTRVLAERAREASERTFRDAERRSRTILERITDGYFALDRDWRFTYVNPRAESILDVTSAELVGKILWDVYPGLEGSEFERSYRRAVTDQVETSFTSYYPDHKRWYETHSYPVGDGLSIYFRDVTETKKAEEALREGATRLELALAEREALLEAERTARSVADRASTMKDEFLATLSHELRTPLHAILGWSQLMLEARDSADIQKGLAVIERNARAQSQIIDDLLDMNRIISGKVQLDVQRLELGTIVATAIETARPMATAKEVRLQAQLGTLHALEIHGDSGRLQQVLWNLLTNATKFTGRGGLVQVTAERSDAQVVLHVIDSGEGIAREFLPFVFDRFRQADATTTRRHGGLGLGLAIVKQLVELHGGSIAVDSAGRGHGSTFSVTLPLFTSYPLVGAVHDDPTLGPRRSPLARVMLDDIRVLIVDDEPDARALVQRLLEDCRARVTAADSAEAAFKLLQEARYDVLVSDIGMPGEDGYSLIRRVRSLGRGNGGEVPAIAVTAYARTEDRVKAISSGFQMHIAKPVDALELVTMVAGAAGRLGQL